VRNLYQVPGGLQDLGEHFRRVLVVVDKEDALLCFRTREGNRRLAYGSLRPGSRDRGFGMLKTWRRLNHRRGVDEAFLVVTLALLEVVVRSTSPAPIEAPVQRGGIQ